MNTTLVPLSFEWQAGTDDVRLNNPARGLTASRHPAVANPLGSHHRRDDLDHDTYIPETAYAIAAREAKGDWAPLVAAPLRSRSSLDSNMPGRGGEDDQNLVAPTVEASDGRKWGANQWVDRDKAIIEGGQVRRLTPLECERLMGWPDDWTRYAADGKEAPQAVVNLGRAASLQDGRTFTVHGSRW